MEPRGWYVADRIAEIKSALSSLEWEMGGARFIGDRAEEMLDVARRLERLATPRTAVPVEPPSAVKVRDAA